MGEIKIEYEELLSAIIQLNEMQETTQYAVYPTSDFLNHGRGKMFDSTNELYKSLMYIEKELIDIIGKTKETLINAADEFGLSENEIERMITERVK